jgi:hypothetical protein
MGGRHNADKLHGAVVRIGGRRIAAGWIPRECAHGAVCAPHNQLIQPVVICGGSDGMLAAECVRCLEKSTGCRGILISAIRMEDALSGMGIVARVAGCSSVMGARLYGMGYWPARR